ncbi:RING finger and CHY zinc finger domain-containing protein 1-like [Thalassophryne amazonica]|uniref:RING finger and CHY zinc finger domain-containing protein 1-like n=1 Tax=Thalassophryne amazonica TaxID=390379 RepID=UPI0014709BCC|nr:RING finger and CHY zinc finger domain-containing protein 1-like [Thalassophryne amazonica]
MISGRPQDAWTETQLPALFNSNTFLTVGCLGDVGDLAGSDYDVQAVDIGHLSGNPSGASKCCTPEYGAPCCGKLYVCRLCHDAEDNHQMDRFKVQEVQCSKCHTVQQTQQTCQHCHVQFGEYYCDICHLFDKNKKQYHCQSCGICRIGPREKYFHCEKCNLCLAKDLRGNHKCVENVSRQNCPVCMEDVHTSRIRAQVLPCSHLLHKYDSLLTP